MAGELSTAVVGQGSGWLHLGWHRPAPGGDESESIRVELTLLWAHGQSWVLMTAPLLPVEQAPLRRALEAGAQLLLGGVIVDGGRLCVRYVYEAAVGVTDEVVVAEMVRRVGEVRDGAVRLREALRASSEPLP